MDETRVLRKHYPSVKRTIVFILIGLLAFILYLYFFVGFSDILAVLQKVDPVEYSLYYSLTIAAVLLSLLFYSLTWYELMKALSVKISLRKTFLYCWLGGFVDLIIPAEAVSGEITRVYLVSRDSEGHIGEIIVSVVSHRILYTFLVLSGLIVSSLSLILVYKVSQYVMSLLIIILVVTVTFFVFLLCLTNRKITEKITGVSLKIAEFIFKGHLKIDDLRDKAEQILFAFHQGIDILAKHPKSLIKPVIYSFIAWFLNLLTYLMVFYALSFVEIPLNVLTIVYSISITIQTIPIGVPVGLVEIVISSLYTLFGIPVAIAGTATALTRIVTFWFQIIVGYGIAQWMGIKNLISKSRDGS